MVDFNENYDIHTSQKYDHSKNKISIKSINLDESSETKKTFKNIEFF